MPSCSVITSDRVPVFWEEGAGANIRDVDGNIYIDLTAGFCVALAGHSNPRIVQAISDQSQRLMHSQGGLNPNPQRVLLAEKLASIAPGELDVSMVASTGAEAVDIAIKTALLYTGRQTIVAFQHGFHGKTTGALTATSINYYREPFLALVPRSTHIPYAYCYRCVWEQQYPECDLKCANYLDYVLSMPDSGVADVAAVVMEPVQGHGGWIVPPPEFGKRIKEICEQHGVLLIADEIITGFGRTGYLFAMNYYEVAPDIMTCGKGLASGFPISAVMTSSEIASAWQPMQHSSTFVGNPVGCAAALASLQEIEERELVRRSRELGQYFKAALLDLQERHPIIGDVRGLGTMVGLEFVKDRETKEPAAAFGRELVESLLSKGIMATNYGGTYHNVLKMSPPLVVTKEQLDRALEILEESLLEVESGIVASIDKLESTVW
jgi:4-aminobutyrate aminotransferase